jgi:tetratricopeptide (TPR) repeat protein
MKDTKVMTKKDLNSPRIARELTVENFNNTVDSCEQDDPCEVLNPWEFYQHFKNVKDAKTIDSFISFMGRHKLTDVNSRDKYKKVVKEMIDDFYSPEDKPEADANFYMYIGENLKALNIFLSLQKSSNLEKSSRYVYLDGNIANIYFDLGRFPEAQIYYQAVYNRLIATKDNHQRNYDKYLEYISEQLAKCQLHSNKNSVYN